MRKFFSILLLVLTVMANAINPILPTTAFIPDAEPHVFEYKGEKRVYIYGSRDELISYYCGFGHDVWSAPVTDLTKWTNHGEIFNVNQIKELGYGLVNNQILFAPDCVYNPVTKKYYLYVFLGYKYKMDGIEGPALGSEKYVEGYKNFGPRCFVAESSSPVGPFVNSQVCDWPSANDAGTFDPSVLVDDQPNGSVKVYAYWGMRQKDRWAEIDADDMCTIINPMTRNPDRNAWKATLPELSNSFKSSVFEASSIRKVAQGKYVFIYSADEKKSSLTYCYSNSPEGPWSYGGEIVSTKFGWKGRNNHGSIFNVENDWYVVYHRHTITGFNRQATMEPIKVIIEGDRVIMPQVEITSQGVETNGLDAYKRYSASIACYASENAFIDGTQRNSDGLDPFIGLDGNNTIIGYKYMNFGKKAIVDKSNVFLKMNIKKLKDVTIGVHVAKPAGLNKHPELKEVFRFKLQDYIKSNDTLYHEIAVPIKGLDINKLLTDVGGLKGKLGLYFTFNGEGTNLCQLKEIEFSKGNKPVPNPLNEIKIVNARNYQVSVLPTKARVGESVKITIDPLSTQKVESIVVLDNKGKKIKVQKNCITKYGPESYNFFMPNSKVRIEIN